MEQDREEQIRQRAYRIWEREGRSEGSHEAHWQQAERELEDERAGAAGTAEHSEGSQRSAASTERDADTPATPLGGKAGSQAAETETSSGSRKKSR
jgi:hypothetical protein